MVDENGYLTLYGQQKPLEEDEHEYLIPILKPQAALAVEEAQYSDIH